MTFLNDLTTIKSPYFSDDWIALNEELWGYKAERVRYSLSGKELPVLEGVFFLTKTGKITLPKYNVYLALRFIPTATEKECQLYSQRLAVIKLLAEDIQKRGWEGNLRFPPGFTDARSFQWLGIDTTFNYTFVSKLPYEESNMDANVKNKIRKAMKLGYSAERTRNWEKVVYCMKKMSDFKKRKFVLSVNDLEKYHRFLGDEHIYAYLALSPDGASAAAQVKILLPGGWCLDWMAGTDREHIKSGINQYLYYESIRDAATAGAAYFDYCGANVELIAKAKAEWGFPLVPYLVLPDDKIARKVKKMRKLYHRVRNVFSK